MAESEFVETAWMLDWNVTRGDTTMALFRVRGDSDRLVRALDAEPVVLEYDITSEEHDEFYAAIYTETVEIERQLWRAFNQRRSVLVPPLEYRDGVVACRIVGTDDELRAALDDVPSGLKPTVTRLSTFDGRPAGVTAVLTDRQREAVETAIDVGYYRIPRESSAADIAREFDCSPSTASELLRRAESRLVTELFGSE